MIKFQRSVEKFTVKRPINTMKCPSCQSLTNDSPRYHKNDYPIYQCGHCRLMFLDPVPSDEAISAIYSKDYFNRGNKYSWDDSSGPTPLENIQSLNDASKIKLIKKYKEGGRLLDIGCALGGFLHEAQKEEGFDVTGIEISSDAADYARNHYGLKVYTGDVNAIAEDEELFDIITMWDVIEHLKNPQETLAKAYSLLAPGGLMFISTGDCRSWWARLLGSSWPLLTPPQHIFYFTPKSLEQMLGQENFKMQDRMYLGKQVSVEFLLFKARESFGNWVTPLQKLFLKVGLGKCRLFLNFGDIMTCVAAKPSN